MATRSSPFNPGDWVVHRIYGVGQVKSIETKPIGGQAVPCLKVKTNQSTFWVPLENTDSPRIRPVVSQYKLRRALAVLRRPPREMDANHKKRKSRIQEALGDDSLLSMARLVRDLNARQTQTRLNQTEETALTRMTDRLVREWAACKGIQVENAQTKLQRLLHKHGDVETTPTGTG